MKALASLFAQFAAFAQPILDVDQLVPELGGHEDVEDRVDARLNERQQVEDDAQRIGDVAELLQAVLDDHLHRQTRKSRTIRMSILVTCGECPN